MRRARRIPRLVALGAVCGACASRAVSGGPPEILDGIHEFSASTGEAVPLRGRLTIVGDAFALAPETGSCRVDETAATAESTRWLCDNASEIERLTFVVDHRRPLTRSRWTGQVRQRRTRTVCGQYAIQNGRQVCVRQQTETYEVTVPVSGLLVFRRVSVRTPAG